MAALPDPVYHNQSASLDQWRHHLPAGVSGTTASYPYQTASPAGHPGVFGAGVTPLSPTQLVYGQGPLVKVESSGHQLNWVTSCDPAQPAVVPSLQQGTAWGVWPVGPGPVQSQPPVQYQYHPVQAVHYPVQQHQRPVYPSSDAARSTLAVPALVQSTAAVHPPTHQMTVPLPAAPVPVQTSARPSQTTPVRSSTPIHFSTQVPSPAVTPITVHSPVPAQPPVPVQEIPVKEVTGIPVSPAGPASSLIPRGVAPSMLPPLVPAFPVTTLPSTQRPVHMLGPSPCQPRPTLHQGAPHTQLRARDLTSQPVTSSATPGTPLVTSPDTLRRTSSPDSGYSSSGSTSPSALDSFLSSLGPRPPAYVMSRGGQKRKRRQCPHCPKSYTRSRSLHAHQAAVHPSLVPGEVLQVRLSALTCPHCHKVFSHSSSLKVHLRAHTGQRPFRCEDCGKAFSDRSVWRRHRLVHSKERPYECVVCGLSFSQSGNLHRHVRTQHGDVTA